MNEDTLIKVLKISIIFGLCLFALGGYLHLFSERIQALGATGIVISAACIALGFIFSLPTKIYLTILLMKRESDNKNQE
ncbi:hypothetical protein N8878_03775 [Psychromonas sp.]|nr:hypothetical protein [Psychromonas sp.]